MARREFLKEEKYNNIKMMLSTGVFKNKQIAEIMGVSESTISRCSVTENFDDYINYKKKRVERHKELHPGKEQKPEEERKEPKEIVEHRQTIVVQASHYMLEEQKKTNELLTLISNKLSFIVDELTK